MKRRHENEHSFLDRPSGSRMRGIGGASGKIVHHTVSATKKLKETFRLGKDMLWQDVNDFELYFDAKPEALGIPYKEYPTPTGVLTGYRTKAVSGPWDKFPKHRKPVSVIEIDLDFENDVAITGNFGDDSTIDIKDALRFTIHYGKRSIKHENVL